MVTKNCAACRTDKALECFSPRSRNEKGLRSECKSCSSTRSLRYQASNQVQTSAAKREWRRSAQGKAVTTFHANQRYMKQNRACPSWLTDSQIEHIKTYYGLSALCTRSLGIQFQVDHIVPINGKDVCGLHVPWNLQVTTKEYNLQKGNRHE